MKYQKEGFWDVITEIVPLLTKHWKEIALNKDKIPLAPNYSKYEELEKEGVLDIFTVRDDKDKLVGYCITMTMPHLHYWTTLMSNVDILYLDPAYRGKMAGIRLMKFTEEMLEKRGVTVLLHHVKDSNDFSPMLKRLGYYKHETLYGKVLGE